MIGALQRPARRDHGARACHAARQALRMVATSTPEIAAAHFALLGRCRRRGPGDSARSADNRPCSDRGTRGRAGLPSPAYERAQHQRHVGVGPHREPLRAERRLGVAADGTEIDEGDAVGARPRAAMCAADADRRPRPPSANSCRRCRRASPEAACARRSGPRRSRSRWGRRTRGRRDAAPPPRRHRNCSC